MYTYASLFAHYFYKNGFHPTVETVGFPAENSVRQTNV